MTLSQRTSAGFAERFGMPPAGLCFAPGRVNLIGDHVDYNDGLVLPMPISAGTAAAWAPGNPDEIVVAALDLDAAELCFALSDNAPQAVAGWHGYARGMAAAMRARGLPVAGARLAIAGNLPQGAGLSSSASLCIAIGRALSAAAGNLNPDPVALALAAQQAEHEWAGVQCGIMDQLAIAAGRPGVPLLIDCENLETQSVAMPEGWAVLIVQSGVQRGLVDGEYNLRRADCLQAADVLGVASLRQAVRDGTVLVGLEPRLLARARHVTREIALVRDAVAAVAQHDLHELGRLMAASHRSLRDDFAVSHPEVDRLVAIIARALDGRGGVRMTGGGFGGAVVAIAEQQAVPAICDAIRAEYTLTDGGEPVITIEHFQAALHGPAHD